MFLYTLFEYFQRDKQNLKEQIRQEKVRRLRQMFLNSFIIINKGNENSYAINAHARLNDVYSANIFLII